MKIAPMVIVALLALSQLAMATESGPAHVSRSVGRTPTFPRIIDVSIVKVRADKRSIVQAATVVLPEDG